jgi:hypothetical protein
MVFIFVFMGSFFPRGKPVKCPQTGYFKDGMELAFYLLNLQPEEAYYEYDRSCSKRHQSP